MSLFFSQIEEIFDNQTKDVNFEKINNHYKDKTFRFDINDQDEKTNCFLSKDNEKNFDFLKDAKRDEWLKEWKDNNYKKCQSFGVRDIDLESSFKILGEFDETKFITKKMWKDNWKDIIKKIKNDNDLQNLFDIIFEPRLKQKYKNKSQYLEAIDNIYEYKSISKIKTKFQIFENKINCTNVEQGQLGTCYFLETISTLSNYGHLLYQLFPKEKINNEGFYEICMFHKGKWVKVLVDDYFVFLKNTDIFAFCQPVNNCLYSCFLEKAYAKINGSYADINGSKSCMAFEALTGFNSFEISAKNKKIYNFIYNKIEDGYLFSCSANGHAYSIISILNEKKDKIFQIRNPWSSLSDEELELFKAFLKKNPKYKKEKPQENETGIFFLDKISFSEYFDNVGVCEILFDSTIYYYELNNISYNINDKFYIFFEIFEDSKIYFDMYDKNKIGFRTSDNFSVELKDMMKDYKYIFPFQTIRYYENETSFDIDKFHEIKKSKYLLKIDFLNNKNLKNKILKIIIGGNVNLKYLGCNHEDPKIFSETEQIEFKRYNYGVETGQLFKKYRNIIRALKEEFNIEMSQDAKGFYIETIFTNEVETIIKFDKEKLINQICSYDKKEDVYFIGNKHSNGKIEDDNGKVLILVDEEFFTIYTGKIHKNKLECLFINLDEQLGEAILRIPNITNFNQDSEISSRFHNKHKLKYKSAQGNWKCHFCSRTFDASVDSFGCKKCDFYLCLKCMFDEINYSIYIQFKFEIKNIKNNKIRLFGGEFVRNNKKRKILYNEKELKLNEYYNLEEFFPINNINKNEQELLILLKGINRIDSMKNMFCTCKFKSIKFFHNNLEINTSTITDMSRMFYDCRELENIDLSQLDTSNVTNMKYMFYNCNKLKQIKGIEKFNTENVINMGGMFFWCKELVILDLSSFDTSNVIDMSFMFSNNYKLEKIKGINKFNTKQVFNMSFMFSKCEKLKYLDLSEFDTSKVKYMINIFCGCKTKKIIGIKNFINYKIK